MWPEGFCLVVGGSGGIGRAICLALARDGCDVVLTYHHNQAAAEAVVREITGLGRRAEARQLVLPDGEPGDLRGLHSVIFAAGPPIGQPYLSQLDPAELRRVMDVELHGFAAVIRASLAALRAARGSVVAITSAGLGRFPPGDGLSVVPKAAVRAMVRGLAREEGRHGVRANTVAVGVVEAGMFERIEFDPRWRAAALRQIPLRRFGAADEVAAAAVFLASPRASYISGQELFVDGGYTV